MISLDKIWAKWADLEASYKQVSATRKLTRREFLGMLLNAKEGKINITPLLDKLSSEADTYTEEEADVYTRLMEKIDKYSEVYVSSEDSGIESFDLADGSSPLNFNIRDYQIFSNYYRSGKELLESGHAGSYSDEAGVATLDPEDVNMKVVHGAATLTKWLYDLVGTEDDDFLVKAFSACLSLYQKEKRLGNLTVINTPLFRIERGYAKAGTFRIPYKASDVKTLQEVRFKDASGKERIGKCSFLFVPSAVEEGCKLTKATVKIKCGQDVVLIL